MYVATSNAGKLRDFAAAARLHGIAIEALPGLGGIAPPPEDEDTFEGNARAKAVYYSRLSPGARVLVDDSGLEVDALGGRPGVRSARFAQDVGLLEARHPERGTDIDTNNNEALLLAMLEETDRRARYRCALALACDGVVEMVTFGALEGEILNSPVGRAGFGYDPLFFVPELRCTMAEAAEEDRLQVSHRGRALRSLLQQWHPAE